MEYLGISPLQLVGGLLIFVRILGVFASAPIFGHLHLPAQIKAALALLIAVVVLPVVHAPDPRLADSFLLLAAAATKEAVVGLIIGYLATLVYMAIQLAGEVTDIQVGFGLANLADPLLGTQASLIGQFQYIFATLFFLTVNGHHLILAALAKSFEIVPLDGLVLHAMVGNSVLDIFGELFLIGLRIGGPIMLAVFLTDLALGLLGRTVPQMNLLLVGFPVKIFVGLAMLLASLPFFMTNCSALFTGMYKDIQIVLHAM